MIEHPATPLVAEYTIGIRLALIAAGTVLAMGREGRPRRAAKGEHPGKPAALMLAMTRSKSGVMPVKETAAYDSIGVWLVPLALPLLRMQPRRR